MPASGNRSSDDQVSVSGNAYAFVFGENTARLEGAEIRIAELPDLGTVAGPNGAYSLRVPDRTLITPYATVPGYHRTYLQTFFTTGRNLERVNFQVPEEPVYEALAGIVGAELDPDSSELLGRPWSRPSSRRRDAGSMTLMISTTSVRTASPMLRQK